MRRKESPDRASSLGVLSGKQDGAGARGGANEDANSSGHPLSLIPPGALEHELYQSCPSIRQGGTFVMLCHLVIAQVCGGQGDL